MGTVKSGWLEKEGPGIFWKGWKRRHCVLYQDGEFALYERTTDAKADLRIHMRSDCKRIDVGFDIHGNTNLPKGRADIDALFAVVCKHSTHTFLAPSISECRQWVAVLENARTSKAPPSKKVPMAPVEEQIAPPPYSPMEYSQPLRATPGNNNPTRRQAPAPPVAQPYQHQPYQQQQQQGYYPPPPPQQPVYGQPAYGQPMYGQPMYGQPMYVSQAPQQQPQGNNNTRNMLLAGGGGLLGGYMLGNMMSESMHHHGGGGDYGGGGGFDGGGFDGGGFDF